MASNDAETRRSDNWCVNQRALYGGHAVGCDKQSVMVIIATYL